MTARPHGPAPGSPSQTKVTHQQKCHGAAGASSALGRECCRAGMAGTEVTGDGGCGRGGGRLAHTPTWGKRAAVITPRRAGGHPPSFPSGEVTLALGPALVASSSSRAHGVARDPLGPAGQWAGPGGRLPGGRGAQHHGPGPAPTPGPQQTRSPWPISRNHVTVHHQGFGPLSDSGRCTDEAARRPLVTSGLLGAHADS